MLPFRDRNTFTADGSTYALMSGSRQPTDLGWWLLHHMAAQKPQPMKQAALAEAMKVSPATISRWLHEDIRPNANLLVRAADILGGSRTEILRAAGYGDDVVAAVVEDPDHRLVVRLRRILAANSGLNPAARAALEATLDVVLDGILRPYEQQVTSSRRRTG